MTELEIIRSLKTNTRQFRDLLAEETAWAIAHYADMQYESANGVRRFKITTNFASEYVHRLRADYPEPAESPVPGFLAACHRRADGFAAECELAEQAVLLERAKNNRDAWKWMDPELKALFEEVRKPTGGVFPNVIVKLTDDLWTQYCGGRVDGDYILRIHKDYQPPKPAQEPEAPVILTLPHIDGWKGHVLAGFSGPVAILYLPEGR